MLRRFLEQIGRDLRSFGFHPFLLLPLTFELLINFQSPLGFPEGGQIAGHGMPVLTVGWFSFSPFAASLGGFHTLLDPYSAGWKMKRYNLQSGRVNSKGP